MISVKSSMISLIHWSGSRENGVHLDSIKNQDYRGEVEIIIADGGSTDSTLEIARKYTDKIYPNPLITGEAGKAAAVSHELRFINDNEKE